ncbi:MAG: aldehyde dehydrogenase family protein [Betaproteobacteria bacterium]|nr:MAG: aldehyde dehydrogenase family protein [Betaproteobacteria bacterium]
MAKAGSFKLTYATMFDPPEELHQRFESAVEKARASLGGGHALHIDGKDRPAEKSFEKLSPIDTRWSLGRYAAASSADVGDAMEAAARAFDGWRRTPVRERLAFVRRIGALIEERVYDLGAAMAVEVGKNRMESVGEAFETAEFFRLYPDMFEQANGFDLRLPDDPLPGWKSRNRSVLKPYGAWCVISPFNFPLALSGGPVAAALVTGNTVVLKVATDTPLSGRLLADCVRDAGLPKGVFNLLAGSGGTVGEAMLDNPHLAGITFTGSYDVGMRIYRHLSSGRYPRPAILEMGGKNAVAVTRNADLERATLGIVRSAYGLQGQKCSALSRIYVDKRVADELVDRLKSAIAAIKVGDPTRRENWMGPVIHGKACDHFAEYAGALAKRGRILAGGKQLKDGNLAHGYYCAPTLADAGAEDALWGVEMFVPIAMLARVESNDEAMRLANRSELGLTAGVYGSPEEVEWFLDRIQAGVTYANRPQGATTGAWPGYQAFGGWKGSGSTGKAIGSAYYLPLYMREQSQTVVD